MQTKSGFNYGYGYQIFKIISKHKKEINIQEKQDKNYITTIISITKNNFWQQLPGFFAC